MAWPNVSGFGEKCRSALCGFRPRVMVRRVQSTGLMLADNVATISQAVVGGEEATADTAVALLLSEKGAAYCSGTVVARQVVLTAGHCVKVAVPMHVKVAEHTVAVTSFVSHPQFRMQGLLHDVALVFLEEDAGVAPARFGVAPRVGERVRVVGYGLSGPLDAREEPTRRTGFQKVESVAMARFRNVPDPSSPCGRDSGGAVFDASGALVGVISAGDLDCANFAFATRVDAHRDFIDTALSSPEESDHGCSVSRERPATMVAYAGFLVVICAVVRRRQRT